MRAHLVLLHLIASFLATWMPRESGPRNGGSIGGAVIGRRRGGREGRATAARGARRSRAWHTRAARIDAFCFRSSGVGRLRRGDRLLWIADPDDARLPESGTTGTPPSLAQCQTLIASAVSRRQPLLFAALRTVTPMVVRSSFFIFLFISLLFFASLQLVCPVCIMSGCVSHLDDRLEALFRCPFTNYKSSAVNHNAAICAPFESLDMTNFTFFPFPI
jgi:hypothetical protein